MVDSFHTDSDWYFPLVPSAMRSVPPTPVTYGSLAGVLTALKYALPSQVY